MENVVGVQRHWRNYFETPPPKWIIITRLCDKFETDRTVQNVNKGQPGRPHSSSNNESVAILLHTSTQSPKKSVK
jgi:hypothetical protein